MKIRLLPLATAALLFAGGLAQAQKAAPYLERLCNKADETKAQEDKVADHLAAHLKLSDAQKAAFKEFQAARAKANEDVKAKLCGAKPDLSSFKARLELHQKFLEDRLEALKAENPKLIAFYDSLDATQQKLFDELRSKVHGK